MNKLILITFSVIFISCSTDRTISEISAIENDLLLEYQNLTAQSLLNIAGKNEPGEKLILCLTFINKENKNVLANQFVQFYHTSTTGNYEPSNPNDETSARLSGQSKTNKKGQIYIETILPGDYGSAEDNRHIHTIVYGAKPEAYDIHFKQYSSYMGRHFAEGSDQHFLADLKKTKDNTLISFLTIEVKNPTQVEQ